MTPFSMSGSVQVSVICVSVGSAVNAVGGEEAVERAHTYNSIMFTGPTRKNYSNKQVIVWAGCYGYRYLKVN